MKEVIRIWNLRLKEDKAGEDKETVKKGSQSILRSLSYSAGNELLKGVSERSLRRRWGMDWRGTGKLVKSILEQPKEKVLMVFMKKET